MCFFFFSKCTHDKTKSNLNLSSAHHTRHLILVPKGSSETTSILYLASCLCIIQCKEHFSVTFTPALNQCFPTSVPWEMLEQTSNNFETPWKAPNYQWNITRNCLAIGNTGVISMYCFSDFIFEVIFSCIVSVAVLYCYSAASLVVTERPRYQLYLAC